MSISETGKPVILTGDRTTGPLHLGHYVGTLKNRVELQHSHEQFLLMADMQALTDNAENPDKVRRNVLEVAFDYLAVGIDPQLTTICLQSALPALAELTMLYMNFVTVSRLERNPTIKTEIKLRGFERDVPAGFLCYPVSQAADITAFKASVIPVGEDQLPLIEQTNELVRRLNRQIGQDLLVEAQALIPAVGRLPGIDGQAKMSKSLGNAIFLSASADEIHQAIRQMYTDPQHLRASDPGRVEGNVVFTYLDAFCDDLALVADLKERYQRGGLGDMLVKNRLEEVLQAALAPIRERRRQFAGEPAYVLELIRQGTRIAQQRTQATLQEVKTGLGLFMLD